MRATDVLLRGSAVALLCSTVIACSSPGTAPIAHANNANFPEALAKTDLDHFAEAHQRRIFASLRRLALKLYKRNPREWHKTGVDGAEAAVARIFDGDHGWHFDSLGNRRDIEALRLAFDAEFSGDRVHAFIVGLASMVQTAFGDRVEFFVLDDLDAQRIYNAARNVEIAAWKLASARDAEGAPLLLSNEIGEVANLSFEREFGRIIGQLEVLSDVVAEKSERAVTRVVQNLAAAAFLPVR